MSRLLHLKLWIPSLLAVLALGASWAEELADAGSRIAVGVPPPKPVYALGEGMPMEVWFSCDAPDSTLVWPEPNTGAFEVIAVDAEPLVQTATAAPQSVTAAQAIIAMRNVVIRDDIAGRYRWLDGRPMREFSLVWRGVLRIGAADATPVEFVSSPVRFVVRDPTQMPWGRANAGLTFGLAATRDSVDQGDHLLVHMGLQFDAATSPTELGMLNDFSSSVAFTFENIATGESIVRGPKIFVGPGPPRPLAEDFIELRRQLVTMRPVAIPLLTPDGQQLPSGTYRLTGLYANEGKAEIVNDECWMAEPYTGPWTFWKGKIHSKAILVHVRPRGPMSQELLINSTFKVKSVRGRTCWGLSTENPLRITVTKRPGFYLGRKAIYSFTIGEDPMRPAGSGLSSVWEGGGYGCRLTPDDESRLAAGERLSIRAETTIFETSEPPGHFWRPESGDYRVLWQGLIKGSQPGK